MTSLIILGSSDIWSDAVLKRRKPLNKLYIWICTNKCTAMNSSFLYHAWELYHHKCLREEYNGYTIILHIESKRAPKCCPQCGHPHLVKNGFRTRDFISLPIGGKKVILRMKVRRYKCKDADCDYVWLWLSGTDLLCPRRSQLHSSFCKVWGCF